MYESFCEKEERVFGEGIRDHVDHDTYLANEGEEYDDTLTHRYTIRGQKEKENIKEKQQQKAFKPSVENNLDIENRSVYHPKTEDVKEIIEFWDYNRFGLSNINAKQQLLSWLDDSRFLQPKQMILKAMNIACANNKRKLNYVVGILRNWENESLLTVEEIDSNHENQKPVSRNRQVTDSNSYGRDIPSGFELDFNCR